MRHGVVIPCYNESSRLDLRTFIAFAERQKDIVLCFVNDGSADNTRATLAIIKNQVHENVHILSTDINAGKAEAVRQGALFLFEETEVETIGFLDADLSTSFAEFSDLIHAYEESLDTQIVFGSRNLAGEAAHIDRNPFRKLLSVGIGALIRMITRLSINDTQCGAKIFDRDLVPVIYTQSFFSRWLFDVEILLRLKKELGTKCFVVAFLEVPLKKWVHVDDSKLSLKDSFMIPANLFTIWLEYELKPTISRLF